MAVYMIHFYAPVEMHINGKHRMVTHYIGYTNRLYKRIHTHLNGRGAKPTRYAYASGIKMMIGNIWYDGSPELERELHREIGELEFIDSCSVCRKLAEH